jgi:hypothetical protein
LLLLFVCLSVYLFLGGGVPIEEKLEDDNAIDHNRQDKLQLVEGVACFNQHSAQSGCGSSERKEERNESQLPSRFVHKVLVNLREFTQEH